MGYKDFGANMYVPLSNGETPVISSIRTRDYSKAESWFTKSTSDLAKWAKMTEENHKAFRDREAGITSEEVEEQVVDEFSFSSTGLKVGDEPKYEHIDPKVLDIFSSYQKTFYVENGTQKS